MGWKGNLRSAQAALRRADRAATRRQRELERQLREAAKLEDWEQARLEVEEYENYVERLVTLHQEGGQRMDWTALAAEEEPARPVRCQAEEQAARAELANYRPSLLDRLLGRREKRRAELEAAVERAPAADQQAHERSLQLWEAQFAEWKESTDMAARVLRGDTAAIGFVVRELRPCAEIAELGSRLDFHPEEDLPLHVILHVHGEDVLPKQAKSLLRSGRIAEKPLPKGRYFEIYQDHVCSALLRVAREVFALLPVDAVFVTAMDELLDPRTGHLVEQPIVSAAIPRATFESLNLERIDPSESLRNFIHRMEFKKTAGFAPIEALDPRQTPLGTA